MPKESFEAIFVMVNHELSPLDAICVAPVYMAAWAQEHASSETCLMASSYRKRCALLGLIRGKHLPRSSMLS